MADCKIGPERAAQVARVWPDILAAIAAGELVRDALAAVSVSVGELRAWRSARPELDQEWDKAREQSADSYHDEAMAVARSRKTKEDAPHARTHIDTLKWAARIRNPRLYGERSTVDLNVRTVDLTRIIDAANARLSAARVIEGHVVRSILPAPEMADLL